MGNSGPPFTHSEAYIIITKGDKRTMPEHFDPDILEIFKKNNKVLEDIFEQNKVVTPTI